MNVCQSSDTHPMTMEREFSQETFPRRNVVTESGYDGCLPPKTKSSQFEKSQPTFKKQDVRERLRSTRN